MCPRTALGLDWKNSSGGTRFSAAAAVSMARAVARSPLLLASSRAVLVGPFAGGPAGP